VAFPIPKLRYVLCDRKGPVSLHATVGAALDDYAKRRTVDVSRARLVASLLKSGWSIKKCKAWFTVEKDAR
jgi:hypothetical protein